jgi:hypothetical protein
MHNRIKQAPNGYLVLGDNCEWPSNGEVDIMELRSNLLANFAWEQILKRESSWIVMKKNTVDIFVNKTLLWLQVPYLDRLG